MRWRSKRKAAIQRIITCIKLYTYIVFLFCWINACVDRSESSGETRTEIQRILRLFVRFICSDYRVLLVVIDTTNVCKTQARRVTRIWEKNVTFLLKRIRGKTLKSQDKNSISFGALDKSPISHSRENIFVAAI